MAFPWHFSLGTRTALLLALPPLPWLFWQPHHTLAPLTSETKANRSPWGACPTCCLCSCLHIPASPRRKVVYLYLIIDPHVPPANILSCQPWAISPAYRSAPGGTPDLWCGPGCRIHSGSSCVQRDTKDSRELPQPLILPTRMWVGAGSCRGHPGPCPLGFVLPSATVLLGKVVRRE